MRFWWTHTNLAPIGKPRIAYYQCFFPIRIIQIHRYAVTAVTAMQLYHHRRLELSSVSSVASLLCRGWLIELVAKIGLATATIF